MKLVYDSLFLFAKTPSELETLLCGKCWKAETVDLKMAFYFSRFLQIVKYLNFTLKTRLTLVKSTDTSTKNFICKK